jgi:phage-related protein
MPEMQLLLCTSDRLLQMSELILDCGIVTTIAWTAPCHNASICQNCSQSVPCGVDLLNIPEPVPHSAAVTTIPWTAPCHNASICQNCSQSVPCGVDLLNIPEPVPHSGAVTTIFRTAPCDNRVTSNAPLVAIARSAATLGCSATVMLSLL